MHKLETFFGNKDTFAIRYIPGYVTKTDSIYHYYAYCHLVLGGQIIGNPKEVCYLGSWKLEIKNLSDQILYHYEALNHVDYLNYNDREIFELIWKSNQGEDSFKTEFKYLPQLDNSLWKNCTYKIDETTDAWLLAFIGNKEVIKFLWEGWRPPCSRYRIGKLFSVKVEKKIIIETLTTCLSQIEKDQIHYPIHWD